MIDPVVGLTPVTSAAPETKSVRQVGEAFKRALSEALDQVNRQQMEAKQLETQLAAGNVDSLHAVTTTAEKAYLSLQLAVQVRNKVVEAYQEMMRMQI